MLLANKVSEASICGHANVSKGKLTSSLMASAYPCFAFRVLDQCAIHMKWKASISHMSGSTENHVFQRYMRYSEEYLRSEAERGYKVCFIWIFLLFIVCHSLAVTSVA